MREPCARRTLRQTYVEAGQVCCRRKGRCEIEELYSGEWTGSASAALQEHDGDTLRRLVIVIPGTRRYVSDVCVWFELRNIGVQVKPCGVLPKVVLVIKSMTEEVS